MKPHLRPRWSHTTRGFTLIEMVIAISIFTLVAFSLAQILKAAIQAEEEGELSDKVTQGMRNQMALVTSKPLAQVDRTLDSAPGSLINYRLTVTQEQLQNHDKVTLNGIYKVTLKATWNASDGKPDSEEISQLVYQP